MEARMKPLLKVMKALGDGTRVKIVKLLQHRTLCVCELTSLLGLSQPAISKHLKLLEEADLVVSEREGPWMNYRLAEGANPYAETVVSNLEGWLEDDPAIRDLLARADSVDRLVLCQGRPAQARRGGPAVVKARPRRAKRSTS
jgi:ArsR family transcriptional regulator